MKKIAKHRPTGMPNGPSLNQNQMIQKTAMTRVPGKYIVELVPNVYFGDRLAAANYSKLHEYNIDVILNLTKHQSFNKFPSEFEYETFFIRDATDENLLEKLAEVFEKMEYYLTRGKRVFVHCNRGISRAPSIAIAFLIKYRGMTFDQAFKIVAAKSPRINPNIGFLLQLKKLEEVAPYIP